MVRSWVLVRAECILYIQPVYQDGLTPLALNLLRECYPAGLERGSKKLVVDFENTKVSSLSGLGGVKVPFSVM